MTFALLPARPTRVGNSMSPATTLLLLLIAIAVASLFALRSDALDGRAGPETTTTDSFCRSKLDVELAAVQLVVVQVQESPRRLRGQVEIDKGPAVG